MCVKEVGGRKQFCQYCSLSVTPKTICSLVGMQKVGIRFVRWLKKLQGLSKIEQERWSIVAWQRVVWDIMTALL